MDIVQKLRREGQDAMSRHLSLGMWKLCTDAADEIEALRAQVARLQKDVCRMLNSETDELED